MNTNKKFKKGDKVTVISSWNNKGKMRIQNATVEAFGAKVCRLRSESTGEMFKRAFSSTRELEKMNAFNGLILLPILSREDAESAALSNGREVIDLNIAEYRCRVERNPDASQWLNQMKIELATLEAATPSFFWNEDWKLKAAA